MAEADGRRIDRDATPLVSVASTDREPNRWAVLALLGVAQLMVVLDATIVTIAIPSAQNALHFSTQSRQWIVTAYALAFGSLLLVGGKLGDLFGRKWTLVSGLIGFSIASAVGGLAQSFGVLVAATLGVEGREAGIASAMVNTSQQVGGSVGTSLLSTIFASAVASYTVNHLHTSGLADAAAVHGDTTAFWWAVGTFVLAFGLAMLILPSRAKPRVPTLRAALARHAIGNCHHFEAANAAGRALDATTGVAAR